jgi:acyl-coenzyme A synthetase/AMP-(fatty) acid ligase
MGHEVFFIKTCTNLMSAAPYKYPRGIEFVESLQKTVSGKIKRNELRDREMKRSLNGNNAGKGV